MPAPNLFEYATSELSQDAFVCWLAAWAAPDCRDVDPALHRAGTQFLNRLIEVGKQPKPEVYDRVQVEPQYEKVDVLILVNDDLAIVVEDKTGTTEHSNQLNRYKETVQADFPGRRIAAVYLKTGDQGTFGRVDEAGYGRFLRHDFLAVLDGSSDVTNAIFTDFHNRLRAIEKAVQSYRTIPIQEWAGQPHLWMGLFTALQGVLNDGRWKVVSNPAGGFVGFHWHWTGGRFLQLENDLLRFKIEVMDADRRLAERDAWASALFAKDGHDGLKLQKSIRRPGTWMTAARLGGTYLRSTPDGRLDFDETVDVLRKVEQLMDAALADVRDRTP